MEFLPWVMHGLCYKGKQGKVSSTSGQPVEEIHETEESPVWKKESHECVVP